VSSAAQGLNNNGRRRGFGEDILSQVAYNIAYAGVGTAIEAVDFSETADVRQCRYLPGKVNASGFTLAPGTYSFVVRYLDAGGQIVARGKFDSVEVRAGETKLVESTCIK
jgi:hypothetical protein